jgi:hypothetical protein
MATDQQRELDVTTARDLDYATQHNQKRHHLGYAAALLCVVAPMVIDMMTEVEKECDERIQKAMVHSSKKRLSRHHVPLP